MRAVYQAKFKAERKRFGILFGVMNQKFGVFKFSKEDGQK